MSLSEFQRIKAITKTSATEMDYVAGLKPSIRLRTKINILAGLLAGVGAATLSPVTFSLNLSNPTGGAVLVKPTATVTINKVGKLLPVINATRLSGVGPLGLVFDAQQSLADPSLTLYPFHECHFAWNFGDAAAAAQTWGYGTKAGSASRNTAYGPVAAHVFENAGTYTVTLQMTHISPSGVITMAYKTATVTVTAADTQWAASTVYVSSSSLPVAGSGGVPAGAAVQQVTTWSQIGTLANTYKRILLKRGDAWDTDGAATISAAGPGYIGAYGTGADPEIVMVANNAAFSLNCSDWRFVGLNIHGNGTDGTNRDPFAVFGSHFLFYKLNIGYGRVLFNVQQSTDVVVADCDLHHNQNYSVSAGYCMYWDQVYRCAVIGCNMHDNLGSHLCRLQGTRFAAVNNNTFDKVDGGGLTLTVRGVTVDTANPGTWSGIWTEYVVASDNIFKTYTGIGTTNTASYVVYFGPQSVGHAERVRDCILERNYIWGSRVGNVESNVSEGFTCRDNIIVAYASSAFIWQGGGNPTGVPTASRNWIYNNTIYKADNSVTGAFSPFFINDDGKARSGNVMYNNVCYVFGATQDGATNGTSATLYVEGGTNGGLGTNVVLSNNSTNTQLNTVNPYTAPSLTVGNYAGFAPVGYARDSGVYSPSYWDFMGAAPSGTRDMGAIWA